MFVLAQVAPGQRLELGRDDEARVGEGLHRGVAVPEDVEVAEQNEILGLGVAHRRHLAVRTRGLVQIRHAIC